MMEGAVMSYREIIASSREHLVNFQIPDHFIEDYYKKLSKNDPLYAILCIEKNKQRLFFSPHKEKKEEFLSAVFFREEDGVKYLEFLKSKGYEVDAALVLWPCDATGLAKSFSDALYKERINVTRKKYHVITMMYLHGDFREVEYFWSDNKDKMH